MPHVNRNQSSMPHVSNNYSKQRSMPSVNRHQSSMPTVNRNQIIMKSVYPRQQRTTATTTANNYNKQSSMPTTANNSNSNQSIMPTVNNSNNNSNRGSNTPLIDLGRWFSLKTKCIVMSTLGLLLSLIVICQMVSTLFYKHI